MCPNSWEGEGGFKGTDMYFKAYYQKYTWSPYTSRFAISCKEHWEIWFSQMDFYGQLKVFSV
jgi:hypothetical protein